MTDERAEIGKLLAETQAKLNRAAVEVGQRPTDTTLQERFARLVTERDALEAILRDASFEIPY